MGEEKILETIDVLLQLIPHGCIKAIDQVFLEVADHALVGVTIGMGATGEQGIDLVPGLRLCILRDQVLEELARDGDVILKNVVLKGVTHVKHLALMRI